jgi:histidinol phosphatase-like PHP family hydrolase
MIDLHTHTALSDGGLCPAELIRRAETVGYASFALTDHVDAATVDHIVPRLVTAAQMENRTGRLLIVPGAELTHVRPEHISEVAERARALGALLVLCHGETIAEPVQPGTNRAAIEAGVDVLAHPGLLSDEDAARAAAANVAVEITAKAGHAYTNGHVVKTARAHGVRMVFGSDTHDPAHLRDRAATERILRGTGLDAAEVETIFTESERILRSKDAARHARDEPL